jgi:hypothetical protein
MASVGWTEADAHHVEVVCTLDKMGATREAIEAVNCGDLARLPRPLLPEDRHWVGEEARRRIDHAMETGP